MFGECHAGFERNEGRASRWPDAARFEVDRSRDGVEPSAMPRATNIRLVRRAQTAPASARLHGRCPNATNIFGDRCDNPYLRIRNYHGRHFTSDTHLRRARAMTAGADAAERARLLQLAAGASNPYWEMLGVTVEDVQGPGQVTMGLALRPELSNRGGVMHGGAIMSLIDAAGGAAVRTMQRPGEPLPALPSTDINTSFINPAQGNVVAIGHAVRRGRTVAFAEVQVRDATGTLVALGRATYVVVPQ